MGSSWERTSSGGALLADQSKTLLRGIVASLNLKADPELVRVAVFAQQVQRLRVERGTSEAAFNEVSRTSLLHACCLARSRVFSLLEQAGLNRQLWERDLGVTDFPFQLSPESADLQPDVLVGQAFMMSALSEYGDEFWNRPVDALGLAWAILSQNLRGGSLGARLKRADLNRDRATNLLAEEIAAGNSLVPIAGLDRYSLTPTVASVLSRAKDLARQRGPGMPLTGSLLLLGLIGEGDNGADNTTTLLHDKIRAGEPDKFNDFVRDYLSWYGQRTPHTQRKVEVRWMTIRVSEVFEEARRLSVVTRRRSNINARSLLGALLAYQPPEEVGPFGAHTFLEHLGSSAAALSAELLEYLERNAPNQGGDNLDAWKDYFRSAGDRESGPANVAQIDAESLGGKDLLRIGSDVKAFALLLASAKLTPPLAIGLFGNWGSGKSFFMRKLLEHIERLAQEAEKARTKGFPTPFHGQIVQIEFNAWHYAETNLWASLVTHIFESLHNHFAPREEEERKRWEEVLRRLNEATLRQEDAQTVLAEAEKDLQEARENHEKKQAELGTAVNLAWRTVKDSLDQTERKALAETLGLSNLDTLKEDLLLRRKEAVQFRDRAVLLRQSFLRMLAKPSSMWLSAAVLALVLVGLFLLSKLGSSEVQRAGTSIAEVVAFVGGISTWLGSAFRKASNVLEILEKFEAKVREQVEGSETAKTLQKAEEDASLARQRLEERQAQVQALRAEIEVLRPTQRLLHFLEDRAGSSDYRKHLGLPALVRRDFQQLQKLVNQEIILNRRDAEMDLNLGKIPKDLEAQIQRIDLPLSESAKVKSLGWSWEIEDEENQRKLEIDRPVDDADKLRCRVLWRNLPRIDRIVLYIDDLDRCPPTRVVEVLQAIQLLLAFPLFVVVVGVDARWVKQSLNLRYPDLLRPFIDREGDSATPLDYIEKIFQIPFWLEPLRPDSTRRYLEGLLATNLASSSRPAVDTQQDSAEEIPKSVRIESSPALSEDQLAPLTGQEVPDNLPPSDLEQQTAAETAEPKSEPLPDLLEIEPLEQDFMLELAPLVSRSPRSVKRFLNVYRLYRASRARGRLNAFLGTEDVPGDFREGLILLGILTAAPEIAPPLFSYLRDGATGTTLEEVLNGIDQAEEGALSFRDSPIWAWTGRALHDLTNAMKKSNAPALRMESMRAQLRDVARYSFLEMPPL
jgi:hypothetical protein